MKKLNFILWTTIVMLVIAMIACFVVVSNVNEIKIMLLLIGIVILIRLIITPIVTLMVQHHDKIKAIKEKQKEEK